MKKTIFRLCSQICSKIGSNDQKFSADSKNIYIIVLCDIRCHYMTSHDIEWQMMSFDDIRCQKKYWYACFWNQHRISNPFSLSWNKSENVVEKYFFHPRVPPLYFVPFWVILSVLSRGILAVPGYFFEAREF